MERVGGKSSWRMERIEELISFLSYFLFFLLSCVVTEFHSLKKSPLIMEIAWRVVFDPRTRPRNVCSHRIGMHMCSGMVGLVRVFGNGLKHTCVCLKRTPPYKTPPNIGMGVFACASVTYVGGCGVGVGRCNC